MIKFLRVLKSTKFQNFIEKITIKWIKRQYGVFWRPHVIFEKFAEEGPNDHARQRTQINLGYRAFIFDFIEYFDDTFEPLLWIRNDDL